MEKAIESSLPKSKSKPGKRGRSPVDKRAVLNGILWILRTGAQWQELPERYPPYQTCHRYFQRWSQTGTLMKLLKRLAKDLVERGKLKVDEGFKESPWCANSRRTCVTALQKAVGSREILCMVAELSQYCGTL